tara:strand:- start:430 stop:1314 length:885 start_codon:yes stop_codon:yes gene_type:complete
MFHLHPHGHTPKRVVVLGANGFVGRSAVVQLASEGLSVLPIPRNELDLLTNTAADELTKILKPDDSVLFVAAQAPVRNNQMLIDNLRMASSVCQAIDNQVVSHLIYISSDAVYADDPSPLSEKSITAPDSLHGIMHVTREHMLRTVAKVPICVLRPTLIYGVGDPHNGYGPNRFIRQAISNTDLCLFGKGEEKRDHIWIGDVARYIKNVLIHKSVGVLNLCSGVTITFDEIAKTILKNIDCTSTIRYVDRSGPMPHNGYRPFDPSLCRRLFPDFTAVRPSEGIEACIKEFLAVK